MTNRTALVSVLAFLVLLAAASANAYKNTFIKPTRTYVTGGSVPIMSQADERFGYYSLDQMYSEDDQVVRFRVSVSNGAACTMTFGGTFFHEDTPVKFISWGSDPEIRPHGRWSGEGTVPKSRTGKRLYFAPDGYISGCPE